MPVNPILLDFPEHIETERLLIRPPRPGDGPPVADAIRESLTELRPWMDWAQTNQSVADIEMHIRRSVACWMLREELQMYLFHRISGQFVGAAGLHNIDWNVPRFEIGYWVRTSMAGAGYITEAVRAITDFAFDKLGAERVEIRCDARNTRSAAVAERAGFTLEARLENHMRMPDNYLRDTLVYVRLRGEWTAAR